MRVLELSRLIGSITLCLHGCAPLPTVGLGVRSSWRASERPARRTVDLLTGVTIAWAGTARASQPTAIADDAPRPTTTTHTTFEHTELPCAEAVFCRWEDDQRRAALVREGETDLPEGVAR